MSVSRWSLGIFLISTLFFFGVTVVRADEEMVTTPFDGADLSYASLSVVDTRLDSVEGNPNLVLSAKLQNTGSDTRTFRASVEFRGRAESNKDDLARVYGLETYTIPAQGEQNIAFSVERSRALSGAYGTYLVIGDEKGNIVSQTSLGEKRFDATEKVVVERCAFGPSDGDNGVILPAESQHAEIMVSCDVSVKNGSLENATLVNRAIDSRTALPVVLSDKAITLSSVAVPVRYTVPVSVEPGQYQLEVVVVNARGEEVSIPARTSLRVYGNGGKILGLSELKREGTQSVALTVGAAVELADGAEYTLSYALLSGGVACGEPVSVMVQNTNLKEAVLQVTKNCDAPVLSATLLSDGSTVLDQAEKSISPVTGMSTSMVKTAFSDGILTRLPWIIVAVLGMFAGYFIWQKERLRRMTPVWALALVSVFFGYSVDRVQAAGTGFTLLCDGAVQTCPFDATVDYGFWTDKDVYTPGETVRITMSIASEDHPVPTNNLCPDVRMRINNGNNSSDLVSSCYSANQFTAGLELNLTQTAPMTTGVFTIGVTVGQNGYTSPAPRTMSGLSVAVAPTPTASLNISPTTADFPTVITYTLSSTNAQSCEVVQISPTTQTFVDKSTNTTGTTIQSQVAVGSYQFQTRCWSGTNGTGNVSSTDTDSLTINTPPAQPTATFTSLPACSIDDGRSGCNTTLYWTSSNVTTVVLTNCADVLLTSTGSGPRSYSPVYVPYNSGCYRLHDGTRTGPILAQGNASATCSGQPWQASTGTCGNVNAICGTADGTLVPGGIFDLSVYPQICQAGDPGSPDSYLSTDTISNDKKTFSTGSSNAFFLGTVWRCAGLGNGYHQYCRLYREPLCGSATGGSYSSPPTDPTSGLKQGLCQVGTPTTVQTNSNTYTWQCDNPGSSPVSCSATRTGGATAQITARVVVASNETSWWKKFISFVTGRDHTAQATGPDANITTNGTAAIDWTSSGTPDCTISSPTGPGPFTGTTGSRNLSGATLGVGTHTFNLSCSGAPADSVKVIVTSAGGGAPSGPPGDSGGFFNASPAACGTGTINLSWNSVSGATSYQLRDGSTQIYSGASTSYSHTGLTAGSAHSYTVRATNSNGSSGWSSVRNANAPNACPPGGFSVNLTASPANIVSGSSTLSWTTGGNPTWCWATGGNEGTWNNTWQSVSGGSRVVTPPVTTTYTLECGDASTSVSDTATVTVGSGFTCTGSMSNHATVYSGDSTGLLVDTPYSYSATNTALKCQYACDPGYTWDGSQCAGPSVTLTASPSTIASGDSSTLTWTPSSGVTSCWATNGTAPWTNSSRSASGGTQVVSPSATTTYSIECWNATGVSTGIRSQTITVTGGAPAAVNVCPGSATLGVATTQQFSAYYTAAGVAWNGCGSPNGTNVTSSATWSSSNASVATMNNGPSKGLATGVAVGSATMSAVYSGLTANAGVTISCTPTNTCNSASSQTRATSICAGDTFNINDGCGGTLTCSGTRVCDYNWKEVAP